MTTQELQDRLQKVTEERNEAVLLAANLATQLKHAKADRRDRAVNASDQVRRIHAYWQHRCNRRGSRLLEGRTKAILKALNHFTEEQIRLAIDGCSISDYHMGRDPRSGGRKYNDIAENILKNESTIERFMGIASAAMGHTERVIFDCWLDGLEKRLAFELLDLRNENLCQRWEVEDLVEELRRLRRPRLSVVREAA